MHFLPTWWKTQQRQDITNQRSTKLCESQPPKWPRSEIKIRGVYSIYISCPPARVTGTVCMGTTNRKDKEEVLGHLRDWAGPQVEDSKWRLWFDDSH
jgi:hypothetical protein